MYFYMIMPVSLDKNFASKKAIIQEAAQEVGIAPCFPFENPSNHFSLDLTLSHLHDAKFVIADLSFERPSCYYEVGLAQAIGKVVFFVAQEGTQIHQAKDREQTKFYKNLTEYRQITLQNLQQAIRIN